MLLDTGAQDSMLAADWTQGCNLEPDRHHFTNLLGTGGGGRRVDNVLVPQLGIGNLRTGELSLPVGKLPGTLSGVEPPLAGLLGLDTLAPYELDIDRPAGTVGLYVRGGCDGEGPPWPGPATKVDLLTANNNLLLMPVGIDGTTLLAIVDTGARRTLLSAGAARHLGLADAATSDDPIVSTEGVDLRPSRTRLHRFKDVRIGDHVFHDVRLAISDADLPIGDMLLGEDLPHPAVLAVALDRDRLHRARPADGTGRGRSRAGPVRARRGIATPHRRPGRGRPRPGRICRPAAKTRPGPASEAPASSRSAVATVRHGACSNASGTTPNRSTPMSGSISAPSSASASATASAATAHHHHRVRGGGDFTTNNATDASAAAQNASTSSASSSLMAPSSSGGFPPDLMSLLMNIGNSLSGGTSDNPSSSSSSSSATAAGASSSSLLQGVAGAVQSVGTFAANTAGEAAAAGLMANV